MDVIRRAEERSKQAARRSVDVARHGWEDTERLLRRKWRVHPHAHARKQADTAAAPPAVENLPDDADARAQREFEDAQRKAIVSINGKDVSEDEMQRSRKTA